MPPIRRDASQLELRGSCPCLVDQSDGRLASNLTPLPQTRERFPIFSQQSAAGSADVLAITVPSRPY